MGFNSGFKGLMFSWNLSISITTGYGQADWDSKPNRGKGFLSSPKLLDELSGQASLPFIWHGGLFAQG